MAVAPESIVGEKERGTIATLLVTPMKRSELAVGKVLSLSVIGLFGRSFQLYRHDAGTSESDGRCGA